ncbi:hypothetical protein GPECTOR_2g1394 [Gonium pectorale]|uniref:Uncharacterized protein n=1 Tax=Gonium pectorale TaxID=33097 RepID=A0A150H1F9_GONPE|nr:hypothetical protein GPECTOR_2g1394 [Gonium pectorale]|eukprot:KXZ55843.1 hypothetical protein GPECTOR_2g1394 [Gonium pectorale]
MSADARAPRGSSAVAPAWLLGRSAMRQLVSAAERLFTPCPTCHEPHRGSRDSHISFLNVDDPRGRAYCHFCNPKDTAARVVQVRRNTYHDVMRIGDLSKLYDTSHIQQYTINNGKVIFLRARPQPPKPGSAGPACSHCHRVLMDPGSRFCSLECKLNREDGLAPMSAEEARAAGDSKKIKIPRRLAGSADSGPEGSDGGDAAAGQLRSAPPLPPWEAGTTSAAAGARRASPGGGSGRRRRTSGGSGLLYSDGGGDDWEDAQDAAVAAQLVPGRGGAAGHDMYSHGGLPPLPRSNLPGGASRRGGSAFAAGSSPFLQGARGTAAGGNAGMAARPQRSRQPSMRLADCVPEPLDLHYDELASPEGYDPQGQQPGQRCSQQYPYPCAPAIGLGAFGRANSAPLATAAAASESTGSGCGAGIGGTAAAAVGFPPTGVQTLRHATSTAPAGLAEYLLSLVRAKNGGVAATAAGAALPPRPPASQPPPACRTASVGGGTLPVRIFGQGGYGPGSLSDPAGAPAASTAPEQRRTVRRSSGGPGLPPAGPFPLPILPLFTGEGAGGGVAGSSAGSVGVGVGLKRRSQSFDAGAAGAAGFLAGAAINTGGGADDDDGEEDEDVEDPEVTSPMQREPGGGGRYDATDGLAVQLSSMLSPGRIGRTTRRHSYSAGQYADLGGGAAAVPCQQARAAAAQWGAWSAGYGCGGGGEEGDEAEARRVKPRKGRPQQAPLL